MFVLWFVFSGIGRAGLVFYKARTVRGMKSGRRSRGDWLKTSRECCAVLVTMWTHVEHTSELVASLRCPSWTDWVGTAALCSLATKSLIPNKLSFHREPTRVYCAFNKDGQTPRRGSVLQRSVLGAIHCCLFICCGLFNDAFSSSD
jgi:hypothetical protein